jgi:ribosomal protein S18 acetylase RimI-like enzyme
MTDGQVEIRPADEIAWSDAEIVFGTRGDPSTCWCQFFKLSSAAFRECGTAGRAAALRSQVEHDSPTPGLVAYLDGEPVGWVAVEPRPRYPQILTGKVVTLASSEQPDDASVWAIVCFVVRVGYRRRGLAQALVAAAVKHARVNGARMIEGYPVDVAATSKTSAAELYHGTVSLFEGAGFTVAARPTPGRALMTLHA